MKHSIFIGVEEVEIIYYFKDKLGESGFQIIFTDPYINDYFQYIVDEEFFNRNIYKVCSNIAFKLMYNYIKDKNIFSIYTDFYLK